MAKNVSLTGNDAVGTALKQINPDVAAVFPITPQTELMHKFAAFVANGEVDTHLITVESEHSAMSATIGAAAAGARSITATSSAGLAYMWEMLYIAASLRLPIVMPLVNRALSGPINIHCDHSDVMGMRDAGWIIIFAENTQEAYDNTVQAFRIAEHKNVLLPIAVCFDGFIISHTQEILQMLDDAEVKKFVGEYQPAYSLLDTDHPVTVGPLALPDYYFECKRQQIEGMKNAMSVIEEIGVEYGKLSGRAYGHFETYKLEDAETVLVGAGSTMGTARMAVDSLRAKGKKVGLLKIRTFRPFPADAIRKALGNAKTIGVLDRAVSFGMEGGPIFSEIRSVLFGKKINLKSYIYGLGGRDIFPHQIEDVFAEMERVTKDGNAGTTENYIGLRE
ncbi:MAG: pyruvate ferredoxin oxidoreductase [Planctomycetes bacterium]|nr:pyruvate ferredoxin oxidoreductase [Planctomycetota bacterium]